MGALADAKVGEYIDKHFVSSFQKVGTFRIVNKQKQGGNVACYFCAQDGRVVHAVAGPVDAATMLREAQWTVDTVKKAIAEAKGDGGKFKIYLRTAHADKLRREHGLVVEPITFDPPEKMDPNDALTYRDPTGQPLAPILRPAPIDGPDVTFRAAQENAKKAAGAAQIAAPSQPKRIISSCRFSTVAARAGCSARRAVFTSSWRRIRCLRSIASMRLCSKAFSANVFRRCPWRSSIPSHGTVARARTSSKLSRELRMGNSRTW